MNNYCFTFSIVAANSTKLVLLKIFSFLDVESLLVLGLVNQIFW